MVLYLDHCATTPLAPAVRAAMRRVEEEVFGNPSSIHARGRQARTALEDARGRLAGCLGRPEASASIVLTASGSEANNLALKGVLLACAPGPAHLVVSAIEHLSVLGAARWLARTFDWIALSEVRPDSTGQIDPAAIERALRPETRLVSVMQANNETGMIQPVREIAALTHRHGALFHTDAVQGLGRIAVDVGDLDCDLLTLAAHKFHGPKGAGLLFIRAGIRLEALIHGGTQEDHRRAGTENLTAAVGMAAAAELAVAERERGAAHLRRLEEVFWGELQAAGLAAELNGRWADKLPGVLNLAVRGMDQVDLVVGMDLAGVALSAGAACSSGVLEPSHVLRAMGLADWRTQGGIRISFGRENTEAQARAAAQRMVALCRRLATDANREGASP